MFKSILFPALIASVIALPLIYQKSTSAPPVNPTASWPQDFQDQRVPNPASVSGSRFDKPSDVYGGTVPAQSIFHSIPAYQAVNPALANGRAAATPTQQASTLAGAAQPGATQPFVLPAMQNAPAQVPAVPVSPVALPSQQNSMTASDAWGVTTGLPGVASRAGGIPPVAGMPASWAGTPDIAGLTPDFGAAETKVYRGTAAGPDLTVEPMSFVPVNDFREVFRFNIDPNWVKQRFERISTVPADARLHGLRTAMVTGTNSWDLHGSQTYYFDANHRLQRITFRGWVGDSGRLLRLATGHFGLKPQPTHWAGLYLGNFGGKLTGGLIMKDPDVIDRRNPVQRTAVLMEINQPSGGFEISDEFRGLIMSAAGQ